MSRLSNPDPDPTLAGGALLRYTRHRPWEPPHAPWVMAQTWEHLLFAHWALPAASVRALLPQTVKLDLFHGQAYVGVVPFLMRNVRPRGVPALPLLAAFMELNVRTYVVAEDKPGVWFFSLDASQRLAVEVARRAFLLPYYNAAMHVRLRGEGVFYRSRRTDPRGSPAAFAAAYAPTSEPFRALAGTLEHWLTERYALYCADRRGELYCGEIHHLPWSLQTAEADIQTNTMAQAAGIALPDTPPLLHYARRINMINWYLRRAYAVIPRAVPA